jgi:hypothetical protein
MHQPLLADVGVPMLLVQWPLMLCALIPVIAVEAEVARRQLALPYRKAFAGAAKANLLSTAAGVPLAWVIMVAIEFATAVPLMVASDKRQWHLENSPMQYVVDVLTMAWTVGSTRAVALAAALLLIPTFFVSVYLERRSYRRSWPDLDRAAVDRSVWFANLASYSLLFVAACAWFGWALRTHQP